MQTFDRARARKFLLATLLLFFCLSGLSAGAQLTTVTPIPRTTQITVRANRAADFTIPRTIFGSFLEPIGNSTYNGLWAEILVNPSLETGLWSAPHVSAMLKETPSLQRASSLGLPLPWEPLDASEGLRYEPHYRDADHPDGAANSFRSLEVMAVPGKPTGIRQQVYLPVHRTLEYRGSLYAKHLSGDTGLTVSVRRRGSSAVLASATVAANSSTWAKYEFSLDVPKGTLQRLEPADFVVQLHGDERVDLDQLTLTPADAIDGMDPDEIAMAKAMHTPLVRFGGNFTSAYHWQDGVGPADKRVSMQNIEWGIPEYDTFGTDEFLRFCKLIGARPQIALNMGSGTADEAADWVRYVNAHYNEGKGGLLWELGNELWNPGDAGWQTLGELPGRTLAFSRAVRAVDPTAQLIATGQDSDHFEKWNAAQLTNPAGTFDYLSTHFVVDTNVLLPNPPPGFQAEAAFALPVELGRRIQAMQAQIDRVPAFAGKAHIAFTEWLFVGYGKDQPAYNNMGGAIDAAGMLTMLMRNERIVPISDMTGIMEFGGIWKKKSQVYASPAYYAFRMFASADTDVPVAVDVDGGSYSVRRGVPRLPEIADVPYLDIFAATNAKRDTLTLFCINRSVDRDIPSEINLKGFSAKAVGAAQVLTASSLGEQNTAQDPRHVVPADGAVTVQRNKAAYTFPHASVVVLTFHRQ